MTLRRGLEWQVNLFPIESPKKTHEDEDHFELFMRQRHNAFDGCKFPVTVTVDACDEAAISQSL